MCAAVLRVLVGWDVELVGVEEQEVLRRWHILFRFGSRFTTLMIFTIFYDRFLTGAGN